MRLEEAAARLERFSANSGLTARVASLEHDLQGLDTQRIVPLLPTLHIDPSLLEATLLLKDVAGQINVLLHAIGILWSLPYVLEPGEVLEKLSLGAGNSPDRHWDLETDRQVGEFTFIRWRGGPEPVRKQKLFANLVALALAETTKRRVLYVVGKERPMAYLGGRSGVVTALARHGSLRARFAAAFPGVTTVGDFYSSVSRTIEIVDLTGIVPEFGQGLIPDEN